MGYTRPKPKRLAAKLRRIREAFGISQSEMLRRLGFENVHAYTRISSYELGRNEPPAKVLLEYARLANVYVEVLIDDKLDLPAKLPSPTKSEGVRRKSASSSKRSKR